MSNVNIQRVDESVGETGAVSQAMNRMRERIGQRAFELFLGRGGQRGSNTGDWLKAEREMVFAPDAELTVSHGRIELRMAVPGFEAGELIVLAYPDALTVFAESTYRHNENMHFCRAGGRMLFRRFSMPVKMNFEQLAATLESGILRLALGAAAAPFEKVASMAAFAAA